LEKTLIEVKELQKQEWSPESLRNCSFIPNTDLNLVDIYGGGYRYYIKISHANGFETLYAHCYAVAVRTGENVKRGQIIGYVGNTGRSKGNHLHW